MKQETRRLLVRILLGSALGLLVGLIWIPYVIHSREGSFLAVLACGSGAAFLFFREFGQFVDDACPWQKGEDDGDD